MTNDNNTQQLTIKEKAKVFAMYLGCKTILNDSLDSLRNMTAREVEDMELFGIGTFYLDRIESITLEHKNNLGMVLNGLNVPSHLDIAAEFWIKQLFNGIPNKRCPMADVFAYQYLVSKCYAVPLFFGIGHWANRRTAIELGIAIDKTVNS